MSWICCRDTVHSRRGFARDGTMSRGGLVVDKFQRFIFFSAKISDCREQHVCNDVFFCRSRHKNSTQSVVREALSDFSNFWQKLCLEIWLSKASQLSFRQLSLLGRCVVVVEWKGIDCISLSLLLMSLWTTDCTAENSARSSTDVKGEDGICQHPGWSSAGRNAVS